MKISGITERQFLPTKKEIADRWGESIDRLEEAADYLLKNDGEVVFPQELFSKGIVKAQTAEPASRALVSAIVYLIENSNLRRLRAFRTGETLIVIAKLRPRKT
jgi:hypothetical protein